MPKAIIARARKEAYAKESKTIEGDCYTDITRLIRLNGGQGIVLDTGDFAKSNPEQVDIATNW